MKTIISVAILNNGPVAQLVRAVHS